MQKLTIRAIHYAGTNNSLHPIHSHKCVAAESPASCARSLNLNLFIMYVGNIHVIAHYTHLVPMATDCYARLLAAVLMMMFLPIDGGCKTLGGKTCPYMRPIVLAS